MSQGMQRRFTTIVAGDSIVEFADLVGICGATTLNAGIGGARIEDVDTLVSRLMKVSDHPKVILAVGVNNAMRDDPTYNLPELTSRYAALIDFLRRDGSEVITAMIAPIGENMTLGDEFYDVSRISAINVVIERISTEKRVPLIRFDTLPKNSRGALQDNLTVDGVHLTNRGYEAWGTLLHPECDN